METRLKGRAVALAVVVLLVATALRTWRLGAVPPGLFYDESADGIDALRVLAGSHPIFFVGNQGREPLSIYLQALAIAMLGPIPFALRLPSVCLGILTVAATIRLGRALSGASVGLIAGALVATSFWHVGLSRLAVRTDGAPLFTALGAAFVVLGGRHGRFRDFALGGAFLGASLYTYLPARVFPVALVVWALLVLVVPAWRDLIGGRRLVGGLLVVAIVGLAIAAPLGWYFARHPDEFVDRSRSVAAPLADLPANLEAVGSALVLQGDENPRQNLPGRPDLEWPVAAAALAGLGLSLAGRKPAGALVVLTAGLELLPASLSNQPDHNLRLVGEIPWVMLLAAVGVDGTGTMLGALQLRRSSHTASAGPHPVPLPRGEGTTAWRGAQFAESSTAHCPRPLSPGERDRVRAGHGNGTPSPGQQLVPVLALCLVTSSLIWTVRDYFGVWAVRPDVADAFQADELRALDLVKLVPPGTKVYATARFYDDQPIPYSFAPFAARAVPFDGRQVQVWPGSATTPAAYVYANSLAPDRSRLSYLDRLRPGLLSSDGRLLALQPGTPAPTPSRSLVARLGDTLAVGGYDVDPRVGVGGTLRVGLTTRVLAPAPPGTWHLFAHLVRRSDQRLEAQSYNLGFPTAYWEPGEQVTWWFDLPVPFDLPAHVGEVRVGLLDSATDQRLPVSDGAGRPAGDTLVLGPIRIVRPTPPPPPPRLPLDVALGDSIRLLGVDQARQSDGTLNLTLHWATMRPVGRDYTVFVHLVGDSSHQILDQHDQQPDAGDAPTSTWSPGEPILDRYTLKLAPGARAIELGMYDLATGQRLTVTGHGAPADFVRIPLDSAPAGG